MNTHYCSYCGKQMPEEMRPDATECIFCGRSLFGGKSYCPHCGKGIYYPVEKDSLCFQCGRPILCPTNSPQLPNRSNILISSAPLENHTISNETYQPGYSGHISSPEVSASTETYVDIPKRLLCLGSVILAVSTLLKIISPLFRYGLRTRWSHLEWLGVGGEWGGDPLYTIFFIIAILCVIIGIVSMGKYTPRPALVKDPLVGISKVIAWIVIGIFALGLLFGTLNNIQRDMEESQRQALHATMDREAEEHCIECTFNNKECVRYDEYFLNKYCEERSSYNRCYRYKEGWFPKYFKGNPACSKRNNAYQDSNDVYNTYRSLGF